MNCIVHGVAKSQTRLGDLHVHFHFLLWPFHLGWSWEPFHIYVLASSNSDGDLDSWGLGTSSGKPQRKGFWDWGVDVAAGIPAPGEGAPRPCDKAGMIG